MSTTIPDPQLAPPLDADLGTEPAVEELVVDLDRPVELHALTYLDEGDEVTVGRADIDSYCVLPADGAALLRRLEAGDTPREVQDWYAAEYGETVNMAEFLAAMNEMEFVVGQGEQRTGSEPVRWQRLAAAVFSPLAWACWAAIIAAGVVVCFRHPDLAPHYKNVFFTPYMTVMELVLFVGQFPLVLLHEGAHALAGRRLGLRSRLSIGRRLYFVVFETSLDGLVAVPRNKRYLPMLAGMLTDLVVMAALTLAAAALREPDGTLSLAGAICLAFAFGTFLRFIWQFYFYLQTDIYHVIVTVLGCFDLQKVSKLMVRNRVNRLLGRRSKVVDVSVYAARDVAVGRWYSWLMVAGYVFSLATLALIAIPTMFKVLGNVFRHLLDGSTAGVVGILDSSVFLFLNFAQIGIIAWLVRRDRRRRTQAAAAAHVIA